MDIGAQEQVKLRKYITALLVVQTLFGLGLSLLSVIEIKLPSAISFLGSIAANYGAAAWFVKDYGRAMFETERKRFAMWGTALTFCQLLFLFPYIIIANAGLNSALNMVSELPNLIRTYPGGTALAVAVAAIAILVQYGINYYFIGKYSSMLASARAQNA